MTNLDEFKKRFDLEINQYFDKKIKESRQIDEKAQDILTIIKEFINNGGKRLRPAIFYFAYKSYSEKSLKKILKLSLAFELFHAFALIHDDIIDQSYLRRGFPTVHKKYGIETAILAGDMALMLADELFSDLSIEQSMANELYNEFKQETITGEYFDLIKLSDVEKIMDLKTAQYSLVKPALIGMYLAKADEKEILRWKTILRQTGILFQIKDDLDGIFGDEKKIGKPIDSDIKEGKLTLIVEKFIKKASKTEKEKFYSFYGKKSTNKQDLIWFKKILVKNNIFDYFKDMINIQSKDISKELILYFPERELTDLINKILIKINI
jgi:geranylgeranyl diphosphate synthase, type I